MASTSTPRPRPTDKPPAGNFLRTIIEADLSHASEDRRLWTGERPNVAARDAGQADPARIRTRFPPEPNGYLHLGHAKSICLNFGLAREYDGVCHMRFDDTNPVKEDQEYVDSILETITWLGFDWRARAFERALGPVDDHLYFASDYFELLYQFAEYLIKTGHAYVDGQSAEQMRETRGTLTAPGRETPDRSRPVDENLRLFRAMRAGDFEDGRYVLRARIDMASPNMNMRDPVLYRIRHTEHHRTGAAWCIYPMYDYTHSISDALENITHSICTLEFEDHRPLYDWTLERIVPILRPKQFARALDAVRSLGEQGVEAQKEFALHCHNFKHKLYGSPAEIRMRALFDKWEHDRSAVLADLSTFMSLLSSEAAQFAPLLTHALEERMPNPYALPHQYEFARLNVTYLLTSKRNLRQLVEEKHVDGWDDPRMPTLVGMRRRGYTPESVQLFCERLGVSKADSWIDYALLEQALRDDLDSRAPRATAVLKPLRLVLENFAHDHVEQCSAPVHPNVESMGMRTLPLTRELWIEADDFMVEPVKGYFRLFPGNKVRLRHAYIIECTGFERDASGAVTVVHARYLPETRSGTPGADSIKVKGNIHWLSVGHALAAQVRLYDRLFTRAQPDAGSESFLSALNPTSRQIVDAYLEPALANALPEERFQFERHGYFVADRVDSQPGAPIFNRIVTLRDSWAARA